MLMARLHLGSIWGVHVIHPDGKMAVKLEKMRTLKAAASPSIDPLLETLEPKTSTKDIHPKCVYRGDEQGMVRCSCPRGNRRIMSFACSVKRLCTTNGQYRATDRNIQACITCQSRRESLPVIDPIKTFSWSYGVTTVSQRRLTTLPRTLTSLAAAGFDDPHLFVDGDDLSKWANCKYRVTVRSQTNNARALGNWWLAAHELWAQNPTADFYAVFQDDVIFARNLKRYLELVPWPGPGYLNLYTFPDNEARPNRVEGGFYRSNQRGLGALALVFRNEDFRKLLLAEHMVEKFVPKPGKEMRSWKAVDGGIVDSIKKAGGREYVHYPSLCQHSDDGVSSLNNGTHPQAGSFKMVDATEFLK